MDNRWWCHDVTCDDDRRPPKVSLKRIMCLLNALNSIVYYYCLIFIGMYYISTLTFFKNLFLSHCALLCISSPISIYLLQIHQVPLSLWVWNETPEHSVRTSSSHWRKQTQQSWVCTYIYWKSKGKGPGYHLKKGPNNYLDLDFFSFMKILLHFLAALLKEFLVQFLWTFNMCQYVLETALTSRIEPIHIIPLYDSIF